MPALASILAFIVKNITAFLVAALVILGLLFYNAHARATRLALEVEHAKAETRLKQDANLKLNGVLVQTTVQRDDLEKIARGLAAKNEDVAKRLEAAQKAGGKLVSAGHHETPTGPATGTPIPQPATPPGCPPAALCLLAPGSTLKLELDEATAVTREGVRLHISSIGVFRETPLPRTRLYTAGLDVAASTLVGVEVGGVALEKRRPRLALHLTAGWDPSELHAKPEWTAGARFRLFSVADLDLRAFANIGVTYRDTIPVRGGLEAELGVW